MKWTVAIVAVAVGVTGLCRAAEFSTDQRPDAAAVTTPQPAGVPPAAAATARARDLIAETPRAQPRAPLSNPDSAPALAPWPTDRVPVDISAILGNGARLQGCFARDGGAAKQKADSCSALIQSDGHTSQVLASAYLNRGFAYADKGISGVAYFVPQWVAGEPTKK
jgi:hypothetical protein